MDNNILKSSGKLFPSLANQRLDKERLLVGSIKSLQVPFWFDRSCKITEKKLQANRFICYVQKNSLGQNATEKILDICSRLGMPGPLSDSFQEIIPALSSVCFSYEEDEDTCSYEVYGEYAMDRKSLSKLTRPFLARSGFKWDAFNPAQQVITRYTSYPSLSLKNINEKIAEIFNPRQYPLLLEAIKDILECVLGKNTLDNIVYLEAADVDGSLSSFDIDVYNARLQMKNINLATMKILQQFSIPKNNYSVSDTVSLGHISGGIDRNGKAFIAISGGLKKELSVNMVENTMAGYKVNSVLPQCRNSVRMGSFNNMMLIVTEGCNLRCSYCYENSKAYGSQNKMSWPTAKKAVDFIFAQVPPEMDRTHITFFGGEPTLAFDLIKMVVDYSYPHRTLSGYTGNKYNYVINTNGTILTDEMYEFYSRLGGKLNIRISVDGYKDSHDVTRKTVEGKGSWLLLEKSLPRFRDLKEKFGVKINIINTLNKSTCKDIYYNYTRLYELTGMQIGTGFVHEDKWENLDYDIIKEQIVLLHNYCRRHRIMFPMCNTQMESSSINICTAGIGSLTVNYTGDIFSCHRAYYYGLSDTFRLGNIETGLNCTERTRMYDINNLKSLPLKCQECLPTIRRKCHICIAENEKLYGDFYNIPDSYCAFIKEVHNLLVKLEEKEAAAAVKSEKNNVEQKDFYAGEKTLNGILIFSLSQLNEPEKLWQRIIAEEHARGISIAPNIIIKMGTVKDINDNAIVNAIVRQSFPDEDEKELMGRIILRSFHLPDGKSGKCCFVF